MKVIYHAKEGEMVDWICHRHYGHEKAVVMVLEANPGLADHGPKLPARTRVILPPAPADEPIQSTVRLWD
ncbi:tail protein X [Magnetofaba australis]|uniref:Putative tail X family protein n=1 Tax=Magnetofaba australis IT-1 TaxID=1434232 RepID=A0A1Y2K127_9PROT|nr:tail protein X [Magnetofaba australis]OSM01649.1 putative tail X family protein [Magnetofaba australis IT-1]